MTKRTFKGNRIQLSLKAVKTKPGTFVPGIFIRSLPGYYHLSNLPLGFIKSLITEPRQGYFPNWVSRQ